MDVTRLATLATEMSQVRAANAVQLAVLKRALEFQSEGALALVQAAIQAVSGNPPHLGNVIDTFA